MEENDKPGKELKDAWHADPKNWKFWVIYYNKKTRGCFRRRELNGRAGR